MVEEGKGIGEIIRLGGAKFKLPVPKFQTCGIDPGLKENAGVEEDAGVNDGVKGVNGADGVKGVLGVAVVVPAALTLRKRARLVYPSAPPFIPAESPTPPGVVPPGEFISTPNPYGVPPPPTARRLPGVWGCCTLIARTLVVVNRPDGREGSLSSSSLSPLINWGSRSV